MQYKNTMKTRLSNKLFKFYQIKFKQYLNVDPITTPICR